MLYADNYHNSINTCSGEYASRLRGSVLETFFPRNSSSRFALSYHFTNRPTGAFKVKQTSQDLRRVSIHVTFHFVCDLPNLKSLLSGRMEGTRKEMIVAYCQVLIAAISWRERGRQRKISVSIAAVQVEHRNRQLPSTSYYNLHTNYGRFLYMYKTFPLLVVKMYARYGLCPCGKDINCI